MICNSGRDGFVAVIKNLPDSPMPPVEGSGISAQQPLHDGLDRRAEGSTIIKIYFQDRPPLTPQNEKLERRYRLDIEKAQKLAAEISGLTTEQIRTASKEP
jgi:hypothetical protein